MLGSLLCEFLENNTEGPKLLQSILNNRKITKKIINPVGLFPYMIKILSHDDQCTFVNNLDDQYLIDTLDYAKKDHPIELAKILCLILK